MFLSVPSPGRPSVTKCLNLDVNQEQHPLGISQISLAQLLLECQAGTGRLRLSPDLPPFCLIFLYRSHFQSWQLDPTSRVITVRHTVHQLLLLAPCLVFCFIWRSSLLKSCLVVTHLYKGSCSSHLWTEPAADVVKVALKSPTRAVFSYIGYIAGKGDTPKSRDLTCLFTIHPPK